jgi:hypothetical protein
MLPPCAGAAHALQLMKEIGWTDLCPLILERIVMRFSRSDAAAALLLALVREQVPPAAMFLRPAACSASCTSHAPCHALQT